MIKMDFRRFTYSFSPGPLLLLALLLLGTGCSNSPDQNEGSSSGPNILLIVADDLGYADLGCYGGDIETPNIDALASSGLRFSRFHTSVLCAPSRAMFLSGNDNHIAGMGIQAHFTDQFGYEGKISDRVAIIPEVLRDAGYHTYMAGKWHLGRDSTKNPHRRGFERSFVNIRGAGNHYNDQGIFEETPITSYTEDGRPARWIEGRYSTDYFTDKLIEYIDKNQKDSLPFFAFAAYTSPHWPLQVDEKYWRKYEGRYDQGYEILRQRRFESLKKAGMIPGNAVLPATHHSVIPWDSLSTDEQMKEARKMELYAGMVDNLDHNIGRLVDYLKSTGHFENTLMVFMSDNGAAAEDFFYDEEYGPFIREHFTDDYEAMGAPNSFISYGPQWAEAGSAPFRYFKGHVTEGGIVAPMIISGPGVERKGEIHHGFATLMDLAPTFYEAANTTYPKEYNGKEIYALKGQSLSSILVDPTRQLHDDEYVFAMEHGERAMLRKGDWKIVSNSRPFDIENFELFNLSSDLSEQKDLSKHEAEKYGELLTDWSAFVKEIRAQFPSPEASQ